MAIRQQYLSGAVPIREHDEKHNKCRVIMHTGLKYLCDALLKDLALDRIYTNSWTTFSERRYQDNLRAQKNILQSIAAPYPVQNKLMSYLNSLPCWLFEPEEEHLQDAFTIAKSLDEKHTKEMEKKWENNPKKLARIEVNRNRKLLHQFQDDSHPHYLPSQQFGSRTYRIFGYVLPVMTEDVVKALFPHWGIADLKNCHLAVFASRFNMPDTKALMALTDDIFMEVVRFMGIKPEHQKKARKLLKAAVYAMICGMSLSAAQARLTRELNENEIGYNKKFMHHFLAKELASAVEQAREQIKEKKGIEGAYIWMRYSPEMDIDTFIACWLQSFEMALNEPCYDLAIRKKETKHTDFYITSHQHDGFSFFSEKKNMDLISAQLISTVKTKAEELKVNTLLVIKDNSATRARQQGIVSNINMA